MRVENGRTPCENNEQKSAKFAQKQKRKEILNRPSYPQRLLHGPLDPVNPVDLAKGFGDVRKLLDIVDAKGNLNGCALSRLLPGREGIDGDMHVV